MVSGLAVPEGEAKGRHDAKSFFCSSSFLHELRLLAQYALGEGIPLFQLTTVKALAVIIRRIVSNSKAGALPIIEVNIAAQDIFHSVPRAALLQSEVDEEFFFYPAIQSLIDRIIRWFARPRHRADNIAVLNQLVVRFGGIHGALVGMEDGWFLLAPQ